MSTYNYYQKTVTNQPLGTVGGTYFDGNLVPTVDDLYSIGALRHRWRSLYALNSKYATDNGVYLFTGYDDGANIMAMRVETNSSGESRTLKIGNTAHPNSLVVTNTAGDWDSSENKMTSASEIYVSNYIEAPIVNVMGTATADQLKVTRTDAATAYNDTTTAALQVYGGIAVQKNIEVGTTVNVSGSTNSSSTTTGSIKTAGGVGVVGNVYVGGTVNAGTVSAGTISTTGVLNVTNSTASTSSTTGSITTAGGIASSNTTDATSSTNGGALTVAGGAAIAKKLKVGTTAYMVTAVVGSSDYIETDAHNITWKPGGSQTSQINDGGDGEVVWSNTSLTLQTASANHKFGNDGNVGINTTTPGHQLDVNGTVGTSGVITSTNSTATTSSSTGAIVTAGGIASSNTTDATSSTNGGAVTVAGGAAIAKKLKVGTSVAVGTTGDDFTATHGALTWQYSGETMATFSVPDGGLVTFTPFSGFIIDNQAAFVRVNNPLAQVLTPVSVNVTADHNYTATELLSGYIVRNSGGLGPFTDVLPALSDFSSTLGSMYAEGYTFDVVFDLVATPEGTSIDGGSDGSIYGGTGTLAGGTLTVCKIILDKGGDGVIRFIPLN